ncbi:hypothetical protein [Desulfospira joergensenii]|uniref:hypothetical protein n=1 Tax=Desulfospira joergensenii TaxID=53329 RepID=UPI0003B36D74|nr:hypothetical protein [Desulfospira joergensenii]
MEYSRPKIELIVLRYGWIISFIIISAIIFLEFGIDAGPDDFFTAGRFFVVYLVLFGAFEIIQRLFIYKLVIDTIENRISFIFFKKGKVISINFKDVESIKVNFYISFIFDNKRAFFKSTEGC